MISGLINRRVLVLNQNYEPIMVTGVKRAISLYFTEKIDVIEKYEESLRSPSISIPMPSVIRLKNYIRIKKNNILISRKNIMKRDNYTCQYCNKKGVQMTIDHLIPKQKGGLDTWDNLVAACVPCNSKKQNYRLKDCNMTLNKIPKKPSIINFLQKFVSNKQQNWKPYLFMDTTPN